MRGLCLLMVWMAGCTGGRDVGSSPPRDGSVQDGSSTADVASDSGVAQGPNADLAAPSYAGFGSVFVFLNRVVIASTPYSSTTVGATFYAAVPSSAGATCSATTVDGCMVTSCTGTTSTNGTPPEAAAGVVTVTGAGETVTLHTAVNSHETQSTNALYWEGGETLAISSTGATVKAFSDHVVVPDQIVVSAPYLPEQGAVPITRSLGLSLSWQGGQHGDAVFMLAASSAGSSTSAVCRFPAAQTQAVLSASVLGMFPIGVASFSASTQSTHEQVVGTWLVTTSSWFNAVYDTGRTVAGQLQLNP